MQTQTQAPMARRRTPSASHGARRRNRTSPAGARTPPTRRANFPKYVTSTSQIRKLTCS